MRVTELTRNKRMTCDMIMHRVGRFRLRSKHHEHVASQHHSVARPFLPVYNTKISAIQHNSNVKPISPNTAYTKHINPNHTTLEQNYLHRE